MSFFADLLAGGAAGFGKLMGDQADIEDKRNLQLELLREKQQSALELQRQRAEDRAFQIQLANEGKASRGGGSGGGQDVISMIMGAKTPEERQQALGLVESLGGKNAAMQIADKVYGTPVMQERSYETIDALGDGSGGGTAKVLERAAYIAEKGAQEFQRLYALTANKGDTKGYAQGEDQMLSNDLRATGIEQALKQGKPLDQASAYGSKVGDPATYDKNQNEAGKVRNTADRTAMQGELAGLKSDLAAAKAGEKSEAELDKLILDYEKLKKDVSGRDKDQKLATYDAAIMEFKLRKKALREGGAAKPSQQWTATQGNAAPNVQDAIRRFTGR